MRNLKLIAVIAIFILINALLGFVYSGLDSTRIVLAFSMMQIILGISIFFCVSRIGNMMNFINSFMENRMFFFKRDTFSNEELVLFHEAESGNMESAQQLVLSRTISGADIIPPNIEPKQLINYLYEISSK